jgi:hypothetical protein
MNMKLYRIYLLFLSLIALSAHAQEFKKLAFTGAARGLYFGDHLYQNEIDSITIPRTNNGHVLVDLGMNIRPNRQTEIQGMVRIRNDYGGFWGSGVSFDVRQLYIKGVAGGIVRYQLGDINDKFTAFTLMNTNQEIQNESPEVFRQQTRLMNYDNFYSKDSTWRQQGASMNFALSFSKFIEEIQFHGMASRVRTTDFSNVSDRLFSGFQVHLIQSRNAELGYNHVNVFDLEGTSRNPVHYKNPVHTIDATLRGEFQQISAKLKSEAGVSQMTYENLAEAPTLKGKFINSKLDVNFKQFGIEVSAAWRYVNSDFRSAGAQTKRINYNYQPQAFARITNNQVVRTLGLMDLMREQNAYNRQLSTTLMAFNPKYDNITPYGAATPNRQGLDFQLKYNGLNKLLNVVVQQIYFTETKGEGTVLPRKFMRSSLSASMNLNELRKDKSKLFHISLAARNDQTSRNGEGNVPEVNLNTQVISLGAEFEFLSKWDLLLGMQLVKYKGFDFMSVRNNYSEIYNFQEWNANGQETMSSAGIRYRFSDKSDLSLNYGVFSNSDKLNLNQNYRINQFMLLYQMNF